MVKISYADALGRNIYLTPKKKIKENSQFNILEYSNNILKKSLLELRRTIIFVDSGFKGYLEKDCMTKGRKHGGDGHSFENNLLKKAGMYKIKGKWIVDLDSKICLPIKNTKYLIDNLYLVIKQRCMRHRLEGWKDIKSNKIRILKKHRNAIKWFILAIKNVVDNLNMFSYKK